MSLFSKIPGSSSAPNPSLFNNIVTPPNPQINQAPAVSSTTPAAPAPVSSSGLPLITEKDLKAALPPNMRTAVTQNLVDKINNITSDPIIAQNIRDNFLGYSAIMKEGKFKTEDYLNAVAYVSYKLMGDSNQDAYIKTFPDRYANLLAAGRSAKDIAAYVSAYHKGMLVNLIMEQSMVPSWVLNQDMYQKALNVQADLMMNANSEKVRTDAANSILTHLKRPEAVKGQLDVNINDASGMRELKDMLEQVASRQRSAIADGEMKTIDIAATPLISKKEDDHE